MKYALRLILLLVIGIIPNVNSQSIVYTPAQAHSHNDYEHPKAFWEAYEQQFGSIEADLILRNDTLYTAHDAIGITKERTFSNLYLNPIIAQVSKNNGTIYANVSYGLQLLVDLKTPAKETLDALVKLLDPHQDILQPKGTVRIVISGNTPPPTDFDKYPPYIFFDGRPNIEYTPAQLERVALISQSFDKYSNWNGEGELVNTQKKRIRNEVNKFHNLNKKFRFWGTPDNINTWKKMMSFNVDYLNTDKVVELGDYLRNAPK